jgi:hypothetical protein
MADRTRNAFTTAVVFAVCLLCIDASAFAEIALAQVEIKLERMSGGGCSHCGGFSRSYDVVIRGDGTVEYRDGGEPDYVSVRNVSTDDVIALANEFIAAGFLEARDSYRGKFGLVRQGNGVLLKNFGPKSEAPEIRLMVRIGERVKRVSLVDDYPEALGRLPELVDRIGGPNVWAGR